MTTDKIFYSNNLKNFIEKVKGSYVDRIIYHIDSEPTFDFQSVPFDFKYCFSITILTDNGDFDLHTSMTEESHETIYIEPLINFKDSASYTQVNSRVINVIVENGYDDYVFKMVIKFEKTELILYAAEIYDKIDGLDYKINDEMILAFENDSESEIFEKVINYR